MVAQRNVRRFARKLDDGAGSVWSTEEERPSSTRSDISDVTQKFSGFDDAPADPPMSWWQRRKERRIQEHGVRKATVKQQKRDDGEDQMPKKSTKEKLDEVFDAHDDNEDEQEEDEEPDDVYADSVDEDDEDDEDRESQRNVRQVKIPSSSSKQRVSRQEKHLSVIEANIKRKEQELARLMNEEKTEKAEIKRQKKELKQQRKVLKQDVQDKQRERQGSRHPIIAGFLMALGFVLFFVLIAGIIYTITLATGRPFDEFIRLVIKV